MAHFDDERVALPLENWHLFGKSSYDLPLICVLFWKKARYL